VLPMRTRSEEARLCAEDEALVRRMMEEERQEQRAREASYTFECTICLEPKPVEGSFTAECTHRICGDCFLAQADAHISQDDVQEATLCCPECRAAYSAVAIEQTLRQNGEAVLAQRFLQRRTEEQCRAGGDRGAFCSCPRCELVAFVAAEEAQQPGFRAMCSSCDTPFCSRCAQPRWHFFSAAERDAPNCAELMRRKEAAWLQWRAEGQAAYLAEMAEVDQEYAGRLQAHAVETQASTAAYEAFRQDEQSKAGWVHCPRCDVPWEGSDACSHVTCGVLEAAMGQRRATVGCGHRFDLSEGRRYQPVQAPPPTLAARPQRPESVVHRGVPCDRCGTESINGARIRCLHCPAYNLCLPCLAQHGPEHEAEQEWPGTPHVFEVLHQPAAGEGV